MKPIKLKTPSDFQKWKKEGKRPDFIPSVPEKIYKLDNFNWGEFLPLKDIFQFLKKLKIIYHLKMRLFIRSQGIKNQKEFQAYTKSENFPSNIPKDPCFYKGTNLGDWIGTGNLRNI